MALCSSCCRLYSRLPLPPPSFLSKSLCSPAGFRFPFGIQPLPKLRKHSRFFVGFKPVFEPSFIPKFSHRHYSKSTLHNTFKDSPMESVVVNGALGKDPHSFANFDEVSVAHMDIDLEIDFAAQVFVGSVIITVVSQVDGATHASLDCRNLIVKSVLCKCNSKPMKWSSPRHHPVIGKELRVDFETPLAKGSKCSFKVEYETTSESGGLQWLKPEQTAGKQHPFVFTQFQAIQARSGMPCMDTPSVKSPFDARVTVPNPLIALASGQQVKNDDGTVKVTKQHGVEKLTYYFVQKLPVPSYLIAFVAGNLQAARVGPRSEVFAEPELLPAAVHEFSDDVERFISITEKLTGIPYLWETYNLAILPHSYAYGGMENVCLTFINASLLVGDRSLVDVVAHEIAHSWSGNDATNATWVDFWLNEGFTMYLERLILGATNDEEYRKFQIMLGYLDLVQTVDFLADEHPSFSSLQPDTVGTDPDDAFSIIPYEKGCLFVYYLEHIVGGKEAMLKWLNKLYTKFQFGVYTSQDLKASFNEHFLAEGFSISDLDKINWEDWLTAPGLPKFNPTGLLKTELGNACIALADRWLDHSAQSKISSISASIEDISSLKPSQIMYFLDTIATSDKHQISTEAVQRLEATYTLFNSKNPEIAYRILVMALKANVAPVIPAVEAFVSLHGRGRYVKPVYSALVDYDKALAQSIYAKYRHIYQAVVVAALDKIVNK